MSDATLVPDFGLVTHTRYAPKPPQSVSALSVCSLCGSEIQELQYQMRAADEAHTTIRTCIKCPLNYSRLSLEDPSELRAGVSFRDFRANPRLPRVEFEERRHAELVCVEVSLDYIPSFFEGCRESPNLRYPCSILRSGQRVRACYYPQGPWAELACAEATCVSYSPYCVVTTVSVSHLASRPDAFKAEAHGTLRTRISARGTEVFLLDLGPLQRPRYSIVSKVNENTKNEVARRCFELCSLKDKWENIYSFVTRDFLSTMLNLSPRAWDHKRVQRRGSTYVPKVDGERAYVLVYGGLCHMFLKSPGYPHIGWKISPIVSPTAPLVVIDVENVASLGCYFIDMITDSRGEFSRRSRTWSSSVAELRKAKVSRGVDFVLEKPSFSSLVEAERFCKQWDVPTDGVIAMWPGTTTARKMKLERSIELNLAEDRTLVTAEGDAVFESIQVPDMFAPGSIMEIRFRLLKDGSSTTYSPPFRRWDKSKPNSSAAVRSVLSSFGSVQRSDDTRRSGALFWCDSLRTLLVKRVKSVAAHKKIIMDVGTGTGQSLDSMRAGPQVSYILIEPDADRCEMIRRRLSLRSVHSDPREILSSMKGLKSGNLEHVILNCTLADVLGDEEVMGLLQRELAAVTSFFSCQYTLPELGDISEYWGIPTVCCFYPYDRVGVGEHLIDCLGVKMVRISSNVCRVTWGGDKAYEEPMTTTAQYAMFFTVLKGTDLQECPDAHLDRDVSNICAKVYVAYSHF